MYTVTMKQYLPLYFYDQNIVFISHISQRIFDPRRIENLQNKWLHNFNSSPYIIIDIKSTLSEGSM
jgi:hypothetical protein